MRCAAAAPLVRSDLARFTINAMKSAFIPFDERLAIIDDVIKPRFAVLIG